MFTTKSVFTGLIGAGVYVIRPMGRLWLIGVVLLSGCNAYGSEPTAKDVLEYYKPRFGDGGQVTFMKCGQSDDKSRHICTIKYVTPSGFEYVNYLHFYPDGKRWIIRE